MISASANKMKSFLLLVLLTTTGCEVQETREESDKWVKFICSPKTNGRFQMPAVADHRQTASQNTLKVIIKDDNPETSSCEGFDSSSGGHEIRFGVENDSLKPHIQTVKSSAEVTINCDTKRNLSTRFFCKKGEDFTCRDLLTMTSYEKSEDKFTVTGSGLSLSISNVSSHHAGFYWCGEKRGKHYHVSLTELKVDGSLHADDSGAATFLIVGAVLLTLLLGTASIVFYKRFSHFKRKGNRTTEQCPHEDHLYEEIQENTLKSKSENALTSIYTTAKFPTNEPNSLHYSTLNSEHSSANSCAVVHSNNFCQYSTLGPSQSPSCFPVDPQSRPTDNHLRPNVKVPNQK